MWDVVLDFLLPRHSLTGVPGVWITEAELRAFRSFPVRMETPQLRARGIRHLDRIVAASTYDHSPYLRMALHRCKYSRVRSIAVDLGSLLVPAYPLLVAHPNTVLCPMPLHWLRLVSRGFNQAQILAEVVSEHCEVPLRPLLRRVWPTGHQAWRGRRERRAAMQRVFVCGGAVPASVVLIDDIVTTGATLDACAEVLRQHGAEHVQALVIASA